MATFVGQLMSSPVFTVERSDSAAAAAQDCLDNDVNSLVVVDEDGRFYGLVTTSDLLSLVADDKPSADAQIDEYAATDVVTVMTDTPLREAADTMVEHNIHHLPVLAPDQSVQGILSTMDMTEFLSNTRQ